MATCGQCQKALGTVHVLDVQDNLLADEEVLCSNCAEAAGHIHMHKLQETLQNLINLKVGHLEGSLFTEIGEAGAGAQTQCPACGMNMGEFKAKGRLGCARCYETFRKALIPLLERVHDATGHRGRYPVLPEHSSQDREVMSIRRKLRDAIGAEDYEAAAALRDKIQRLEQQPEEGAS